MKERAEAYLQKRILPRNDTVLSLRSRNRTRAWFGWSIPTLGRSKALLLSSRQFEREVARERVRATRRSIPFCLLTIELLGRTQDETSPAGREIVEKPATGRQNRQLVDLLHRNLRMTDEKAFLASGRYGVLLVDTPEMGGRAVLDRIGRLASQAGLAVQLDLQVHDPEGFGDDEDERYPTSGDRRRDDAEDAQWVRNPSHAMDAVLPPERALLGDSRVSLASEELSTPVPFASRFVKRSIDVAGAGVGLLLTGPFIGAAMVAVKLTDGGPVFFHQTREGLHGRPFTIYKLRTMVVDAEKFQAELRDSSHRDGPAFKIRKDPRVTKVGRFLRATCLDELPQLINVLKGDMSLVGPRPLPWHESRACERWHRRRLDVRPGLTCTWQVDKGKAETFDDWMRMDLRYIDQLGVMQDLQLIARTVAVPMLGRGGE